jgi:hypothetical protein
LILDDVCTRGHGDLYENDLADPFGKRFEELLKGVQLVQNACRGRKKERKRKEGRKEGKKEGSEYSKRWQGCWEAVLALAFFSDP